MKRAVVAMLSASVLGGVGCGTAFAQSVENESGFYVGGGVGQFNVQIDDVDQTDDAIERLDDDDTAWKAFVGWRMNPFISLELAYIDFGGPSDRFDAAGSDGDFTVELSGFAPYVIGTMPLGPVELFGKIGYYFYDVDASVDLDDPTFPDFDSSSSENDLLYGIGVGMTFFERLSARLEYERIDSDLIDDADALWFSGAWRF
jgi:hypothetical protein